MTLWYFIVFYHCIAGEMKSELFTAIMRSNELKLFNYPTIIVIHVPLSPHWDSVSLWSGIWLCWEKLGHVDGYRKKRYRHQFINFWIFDKVKVYVESNWLTNWSIVFHCFVLCYEYIYLNHLKGVKKTNLTRLVSYFVFRRIRQKATGILYKEYCKVF